MTKIDLSSIPEDGLQRTFDVDEVFWEGAFPHDGDGVRGFSLRRATVDFHMTRVGGRVYVNGDVGAVFVVECSRCLASTEIARRDGFTYVFIPEQGHAEGDVELSVAETDVVFYREDVLDMAGVVTEQINLLVPLAVLCRDDCRGLCPLCGKNRNDGDCACVAPLGETQFARLKDLKLRL